MNNTIEIAKDVFFLGQKLKEISQKKDFSVQIKEDDSKVTTADFYSNDQIKLIVNRIFGNCLVLSEEDTLENQQKIAKNGNYFLIDPIDGTESFIAGEDFCINIAYCEKNIPVFGLIAIPWQNIVCFTLQNKIYSFDGQGVVEIKKQPNTTDIAIGRKTSQNKAYLDKIINKVPIKIKNISVKSAGIKYFSTIAGWSGVTINFGHVKDWDIGMVYIMAKIFDYYLFDGNGKEIVFGIGDFSHNNNIYLVQNKEIADLIIKNL